MSKARELANLGNAYSDGALSNRNMIINGDMRVSQRGDSTGITVAGYYGPDRFRTELGGLGTWSVSQSSTAPDGFGNSFKINCTTADASPAAADYLVLYQHFEGKNVQRLKKGTSAAEKSTLSFWIRSNKTGTYQVNMRDTDNARIIGRTYTIDAANTWEHKVVTFDGDTTGAYDNDVNLSMTIEWWLGSGTDFSSGAVPTSWESAVNADRNAGSNVNLADSTSNELYITGVQLEVGDTATPFEHRLYGDQLQACQRYFRKLKVNNANDYPFIRYHQSVNTYLGNVKLLPPMRAAPTGSITLVQSSNAIHKPSVRWDTVSSSAFGTGPFHVDLEVTPATNDTLNSIAFYMYGYDIFADAELS